MKKAESLTTDARAESLLLLAEKIEALYMLYSVRIYRHDNTHVYSGVDQRFPNWGP